MKTGKLIAVAVSTAFCIWLLTGCIIVVPNGCGRQTVSGSGEVVTGTREVPEFGRVVLKGSGRVVIERADAQSVTIRTDKNILPLVRTQVSGDVLEISHENYNLRPTTLEIQLGLKRLRGVTISGSGDVTGRGPFEAEEFTAEINGSGNMDLEVAVSRLVSVIKGSGSMALAGKAAEHEAAVSGSGDIRAFELDSKMASVSISGSGDCRLHATDFLTANISGSGDVIYAGSPRIESRVKGSGSVKARR